MNHEIELLNAIIDHEDFNAVRVLNLQEFFVDNIDIWKFIEEYYNKYQVVPVKTVIKDHFKHFEMLSTKDIPLDYYIDETKKIVLQRNVSNVISRSIELLKTSGPYAATNYLISESNRIAKDSGVIKDTNLAGDYQERVDDFKERFFGEKHIIGIPSGINPIDEIFGGWQPGDFIIILGWSNVGKSYLALLFACHAWLNGYRPMYISLEMNKNQVGYRMDTILGDHESFTNDDLTHGRGFSPQEYERWAKETFENKHPFYLITSDGMEGANQNVIRAKIDQYKPDLVVIDYFNLVENAGGSGNETEKAKTLSRDFKNIAVKSEVPIINIAAVTMKDGHGERPPELQEVAWSRQLAYDADLVLAIHRSPESPLFQVVSRKTRRCVPFAFYLDFDFNTGKWQERYELSSGSGW